MRKLIEMLEATRSGVVLEGKKSLALDLTSGIRKQLDFIDKCDEDVLTDGMIAALKEARSKIEGAI